MLYVSAFVVLALVGTGSTTTDPLSRQTSFDYSTVFSTQRYEGIRFDDLPGFTRSVYERDHALITHESRVWAGFPGWKNASTAHLISKAVGANFAMYLADLREESVAVAPAADVERFIFVLDGQVKVQVTGNTPSIIELHPDDFAYFPPGLAHTITSEHGGGLMVYERIYALKGEKPEFRYGTTDKQPILPVEGEIFVLRKLMPMSAAYDFNVHVMDFKPGEYLNVKEIHYNQHGLLLVQGKGIYRLGDKWYPVQSGDAIWMAPYVVQWFAALGTVDARYLLYKDATVDPLL
eukprot:jgi/Botrbrau1/2682/Bobra.0203s0026.1